MKSSTGYVVLAQIYFGSFLTQKSYGLQL